MQGLRDAGLQNLTQSMKDLAGSKQTSGYSAGYMQGFRDGDSGIYGDRITTSLLRRLEEQYPTQDDFRHGYIEGFRDATNRKAQDSLQKGPDASKLTDRLSELSERLSTLERSQAAGDEVHTTRIYHVCKKKTFLFFVQNF